LGHHLDDLWLCTLPLHHVGGLQILLRCALYGTTARLGGLDDLPGATLVSLVPTQLHRLLEGGTPAPPSLRLVLLGGAASSAELLTRAASAGYSICTTWGMTETASQVATCVPGQDPAAPLPPLPFTLVGTDTLEADGGETLTIRGALAPGGTHRSADRGTVEGGRITLAGRADRVFTSGGENIDPAQVEAVLLSHPAISAAAVVGQADPEWGMRPVAHLEGAAVEEADLRTWCRARLSGVAVPRSFTWHDALPRTELGKIRFGALG
jgi:O-succinylbenzoic acid--CoA ligase